MVFLTGAGISAASGVLTYRGPGGVYTAGRPTRPQSFAAFLARPAPEVWGYFLKARDWIAGLEPNPAHAALARLQRGPGPEVAVITQNVDGFHHRAGGEAVELHGSVHRARCRDPGCGQPARPVTVARGAVPPPCPTCGGPVRPDVVLFGEAIPPATKRAALALVDGCDLLVAAGTSGSTGGAKQLRRRAEAAGARTVCVDIAFTPKPGWQFDAVVPGRAEEVLARLAGYAARRR